MDLEDVDDLTSYWAEHPPVHLMVASYLGIGSRRPATAEKPSREEIDALVQMFGKAG